MARCSIGSGANGLKPTRLTPRPTFRIKPGVWSEVERNDWHELDCRTRRKADVVSAVTEQHRHD